MSETVRRSIYMSAEHDAFRREVRRFLESEIAPHADAWEAAGRIPRDAFVRMGDLGFLGISFPECYGGAGADVFFSIVFLEELPRSMMGGFCAAVSVQQFMATQHIYRSGSEELRQRYLVPSIAGRKVGALAITEPDTGSDVAAIRTTAVRDGDHWIVNGAKTFITNGAEGDFYTLAVRTSPDPGAEGLGLVVVDADTPGVRVSRRLEKLGWHSSDTAELVFEDVRIPTDHVVGEPTAGFQLIMESFQLERLAAAAIAVGSADVALETTLRYVSQRRAFGKPLGRFQVLRHRIADLASDLEAARQLMYHTAWLHQKGEPAIRESSMAKLVTTELGKRVADECLQFHGGYGFMEEYPVARFYRDARGATITAGTSEIMREIIAKLMIDEVIPESVASRSSDTPPTPRTTAADSEPVPAVSIGLDSAPLTVPELIRSLPERLRAERVEGWRATFHYHIRGTEPPEWTVSVDDGQCSVSEGLHGEPDCVVRMKAATYIGIETGTINPQSAFLTGRVKVSDLAAMMRFVNAFRSVGGDGR